MSCEESHKQCLADRQAHVRKVMADNPYDTNEQLAEKAGVGHATISREKARLLQTTSGEVNCNKPPKMERSEDMDNDALIKEVNRLFAGASAKQRRYIWDVMVPVYFSRM